VTHLADELAAIDREAEDLACKVALRPELRITLAALGFELEARYLRIIEGLPTEVVPKTASETLMDAQFVRADRPMVSLRLGDFMKTNGLIPT
jgi:hypothetical protein